MSLCPWVGSKLVDFLPQKTTRSNPRKADINLKDDAHYGTVLHTAFTNDVNEETMQLLLDFEGIDASVMNIDENTPMHYFARNANSVDMLKFCASLVKKGADVNAKNTDGDTPLYFAVMNKKVRVLMVSRLLKLKANVNSTNEKGDTPLHHSVWYVLMANVVEKKQHQ